MSNKRERTGGEKKKKSTDRVEGHYETVKLIAGTLFFDTTLLNVFGFWAQHSKSKATMAGWVTNPVGPWSLS